MCIKIASGTFGGKSIHLGGGGTAPPPFPNVATCLWQQDISKRLLLQVCNDVNNVVYGETAILYINRPFVRQCFDIVGWTMQPVKIVPKITCNMSSGGILILTHGHLPYQQ